MNTVNYLKRNTIGIRPNFGSMTGKCGLAALLAVVTGGVHL
jgi:hypothetical protein